MSRRQDIVDALAERLATITVANGYQTDFNGRIYIWPPFAVTTADVPCLLVLDTTLQRQTEGATIGETINQLTIEIVAMADGASTIEQARAMEADVVSCLAGWHDAGGLADWLQVDKSEIIMQPHEQIIGAVQATVGVRYEIDSGIV